LGLLQRDLGTTMIFFATVFVLLFIAGVRLRYLFVGGAVGAVGVAYLIFGEAYRRTRFFESWLDPWADPKRSGYQLIQGLIAIGSGGWFGTGLGTSRAKWDFLPNAHSDFIFAVIGEELGLLGALVVLIAFGVLVWAGVRIAIHSHDTFERLLADREVERRILGAVQIFVKRLGRASTAVTAKLVADPVEHRAPEIRLKRAFAANLDAVDVSERADDGLLDQVFSVGQIAGATGEPPARPAGQQRKVPPQQTVERRLVTASDPLDEQKSGFQLRLQECDSPVIR